MLAKINEYILSLQGNAFTLIIEILVAIVAIVLLILVLAKYIKSKLTTFFVIGNLLLILLSVLTEAKIGLWISVICFVLMSFFVISFYLPEFKQRSAKKVSNKTNKEFLSNQGVKDELIETLLKAVNHLANRKIGAIITIEKEHNLNTLVEGAVKLDSLVTFELLVTIFHPNTALHDGAVIIRGNRIKCASAFYNPSQKSDIEQHYGSRHRAAIGISEQSDSFTIVVSEETGRIATTIDGTITGSVSIDDLKTSLERNLIVR